MAEEPGSLALSVSGDDDNDGANHKLTAHLRVADGEIELVVPAPGLRFVRAGRGPRKRLLLEAALDSLRAAVASPSNAAQFLDPD